MVMNAFKSYISLSLVKAHGNNNFHSSMSLSTWKFRINDRKAKTIATMKKTSAAFERSNNVVFSVVSRLFI